jgi:hypothetical protein
MTHRFRRGIYWRLGGVVCIGLNFSVSSMAQAPEKPDDVAKAKAGPASIERIVRAWKAREDGAKTLHCVWDAREVRHGAAAKEQVLGISHNECWLGPGGQYRFQMTTEPSAGRNGAQNRKHETTAYDGRAYYTVNSTENSTLPRRGKIQDFGGRNIGFLNREMTPLAVAYRPSVLMGMAPERFTLVTDDAIVNGLRYTKLGTVGGKSWFKGSLWFDPRQADALVFWEWGQSGGAQLPPSLQYRVDKTNGPTLAGWNMPQYDGTDSIAKVKTCEINNEPPTDTFRIRFPVGTSVAVDLHGSTQEAYIVQSDGTKRTTFDLNSISPRRRGTLLQTTDFTVEPEPLRDAIDFIRQRYQIKIALDATSFRAAKIDPALEVREDSPGIRLWEVLAWFSAQCPQPFGILEHDGGLLLK